MRTLKEFTLPITEETYYDVEVEIGYYVDGSIAIRLHDQLEGPLAHPTVCLTDYGLKPLTGFVFVKNYAENAEMPQALEKAGLVKRTGEFAWFGGYDGEAEVCELLVPVEEMP